MRVAQDMGPLKNSSVFDGATHQDVGIWPERPASNDSKSGATDAAIHGTAMYVAHCSTMLFYYC